MTRQDEYEQFLVLERQGVSVASMADMLKVTSRTIARWKQRAGVSHPPVPRASLDARAQARALIDGGCSFRDAAATVGVTAQTVRRWFPDVPAWSKGDAGAYGQMLRRAGI